MSNLDTIFENAKQAMAEFENLQAEAKQKLEKTKQELGQAKAALAEATSNHQGLLTEIAAKKTEADASSEEAARRIKTGNEQVAELMRVKAELDEREKVLRVDESRFVEHERLVARREKELADQEAAFVQRSQALAVREKKFKEALS